MTGKEKIRFAFAIVCSVIFLGCSFFLIEAAICEFCMMPSQTTETFYGFLLFWVMMMELALLIFGIGAICTGALGAFFAYSFRKHPKTGIRRTAKSLFAGDLCLIVLDLLSLVLLLL